MERGVVVGGLMICGSFLLAATLNRSAVDEKHTAEPGAVVAPIAPPAPSPLPLAPLDSEPELSECEGATAGDESPPANDSGRGDLPGNGREACSR